MRLWTLHLPLACDLRPMAARRINSAAARSQTGCDRVHVPCHPAHRLRCRLRRRERTWSGHGRGIAWMRVTTVFRADGLRRTLGQIRLNDSRTSAPFRTLRNPRLIRSSTPDVCLIGVLVNGELCVEQDGRQAVLRPGDLSYVDPAVRSQRPLTAWPNSPSAARTGWFPFP